MSEVKIDAILFESKEPLGLCKFYQRAFGLSEPKWCGDKHVGINTANMYLGFDKVDQDPKEKQNVSVWFKVDDVGKYFRSLQEMGAKPKSEPDSECSPGETLAMMYDPEGNVIGLIAKN